MKKILVIFFLIIMNSSCICNANDFEENKRALKSMVSFLKNHSSCNRCEKQVTNIALYCDDFYCDKCLKLSGCRAFYNLADKDKNAWLENDSIVNELKESNIISNKKRGVSKFESSIVEKMEEIGQEIEEATKEKKPFEMKINHTAPSLAVCGLYYTDYRDCYRCSFCGLGLRNWRSTDNPLIEHAFWNPSCGFNLSLVGDYFTNILPVLMLEKEIEYLKQQDKKDSVVKVLETLIVPADKVKNQSLNEQQCSSLAYLKIELDNLKNAKNTIIKNFNVLILSGRNQMNLELIPINKKLHSDINQWWSSLEKLSSAVNEVVEGAPVVNLEELRAPTLFEEVINTMLATHIRITEELQDQIVEHFLRSSEYYKNTEAVFSKAIDAIITECARYDAWTDGQVSKNLSVTAGNATPLTAFKSLVAEAVIHWAPDFARRKALKMIVQLNASDADTANLPNEVIKLLMSVGYTFDQYQKNHLMELAEKLSSEEKYSLNDLTCICLKQLETQKIIANNSIAIKDTEEQVVEYAGVFEQFKEQVKLMQCHGCHKNLISYMNLSCNHQLCHECRFSCRECPVCKKDIQVIKITFKPNINNEAKDTNI